MYIIEESNLKGGNEEGIRVRMELVDYLSIWVKEVFLEVSSEKTISEAGSSIRDYVESDREFLNRLFEEVVLIDLFDFWSAVEGSKGVRDDIALYGLFCMIFGELDEGIKEEGNKFEGEIGFAPKLRLGLEEEELVKENKKEDKGLISKLFGNKEELKEDNEIEEIEELEEIEDNFVRKDNVQAMTKYVVAIVVLLLIGVAWVIII